MKVEGLTIDFIVRATGGIFKGKRRKLTGVSIDSRTIRKREVFFALKGEHLDGHKFLEEAFRKDASCAVVEKGLPDNENIIKVRDTTIALGDLARMWRKRFNLKCIGITGTSGKTTTRRIINHLLMNKYECSESIRNYNNMVGLPLSLLQFNERTDIAIIEMAMNKKGEIRKLTHIANPSIGVITNVGRGHLEFLGSVQNVAKEKSELLHYLKKGDVIFLNADDPYLMKMRGDTKAAVITYGIDNPSDFQASHIEIGKKGSSFSVNTVGSFYLPLIGKINIYNALAGIGVSSFLGFGSDEMKKRLRSLKPEIWRLNRVIKGGITVYNDSYNANPDSMAAALSIVAKESGKRKIACLGDMLELGKRRAEFHREVGRKLHNYGFTIVFLYGHLCRYVIDGLDESGFKGKVLHFNDIEELRKELFQTVRKKDVVLIKGSHNNRLDIVADALIKNIRGRR